VAKRRQGWQKGVSQTPAHKRNRSLSISDSWRTRKQKQTKDAGTITIRLTKAELERVMQDAEAAHHSASAYVKSVLAMCRMMELPAHNTRPAS
jgi:hypothetical protein